MNLLTVSYSGRLSDDDQSRFEKLLKPYGETLDAQVLVLAEGIQATLTHNPAALHARIDALVASIESLVAVNAALLERLPLPEADEGVEAGDGAPVPLNQPR